MDLRRASRARLLVPDSSRAARGRSIPPAVRLEALRRAEVQAVQEDGPVSASGLDLERRAPALEHHGPERLAHRRLKLVAPCARHLVDAPVDNSNIPRPRKAR